MAGGVEHQQLGLLPGGKALGLYPPGQVGGGGAIGPHQVGPGVFGLDAEVVQLPGPLYQWAAHKGAPG